MSLSSPMECQFQLQREPASMFLSALTWPGLLQVGKLHLGFISVSPADIHQVHKKASYRRAGKESLNGAFIKGGKLCHQKLCHLTQMPIHPIFSAYSVQGHRGPESYPSRQGTVGYDK